jgi:hypothetical protein
MIKGNLGLNALTKLSYEIPGIKGLTRRCIIKRKL